MSRFALEETSPFVRRELMHRVCCRFPEIWRVANVDVGG